MTSRTSIKHLINDVVLPRRYVDGKIWHCTNEIMGLMTTLDVLRITPNLAAPGTALFGPDSIPKTEITVLDNLPDGNCFDLFQTVTQSRPKRLNEWIAGRHVDRTTASTQSLSNDIIPFAGSANSLWIIWKPIEYNDETMLRVFMKRVFDYYGLSRQRERTKATRIQATIVVRKGSRPLIGLNTYLSSAVRDKFADVANVRPVDFGGMPFREQAALARDSNVLRGMHGAGLTHAMSSRRIRVMVQNFPERTCSGGFAPPVIPYHRYASLMT